MNKKSNLARKKVKQKYQKKNENLKKLRKRMKKNNKMKMKMKANFCPIKVKIRRRWICSLRTEKQSKVE